MICYNGALVMEGEHRVFSETIPLPIVEAVHNVSEVEKSQLALFTQDEWFTDKSIPWIDREVKNTLVTPTFSDIEDVFAKIEECGQAYYKLMLIKSEGNNKELSKRLTTTFAEELHVYRSSDQLIEVSPIKTSKSRAVEIVLKKYGYDWEDVLAFGDNYNDIEMIAKAGWGVAVENGRDEVKKVARQIAPANTSEGVAQVLKEVMRYW